MYRVTQQKTFHCNIFSKYHEALYGLMELSWVAKLNGLANIIKLTSEYGGDRRGGGRYSTDLCLLYPPGNVHKPNRHGITTTAPAPHSGVIIDELTTHRLKHIHTSTRNPCGSTGTGIRGMF